MAEITHGGVAITVTDHLEPPEKAGKMSPDAISRTLKVPRGIGLACDQTADSMETAGDRFVAPKGVTPDTLRLAGKRAEEIDNVIASVEVVLAKLKQANLLFDADAWESVRKINDQTKAQGKHDPELLAIFKPLIDFMSKNRSGGSSGGAGTGGA